MLYGRENLNPQNLWVVITEKKKETTILIALIVEVEEDPVATGAVLRLGRGVEEVTESLRVEVVLSRCMKNEVVGHHDGYLQPKPQCQNYPVV